MLYEFQILIFVFAFIFLVIGLIPFQNKEGESMKYINKIVFFLMSAILFGVIGYSAVGVDYKVCYTNSTWTDSISNVTYMAHSCFISTTEDLGLSPIGEIFMYVGIVLMIVYVLLMITFKNERYGKGEGKEKD